MNLITPAENKVGIAVSIYISRNGVDRYRIAEVEFRFTDKWLCIGVRIDTYRLDTAVNGGNDNLRNIITIQVDNYRTIVEKPIKIV